MDNQETRSVVHSWTVSAKWCATCRYCFALLLTAIAFATRYALQPIVEEHAPFALFLPAIMLSAWFGGIGPALLALVAGVCLTDMFFTDPGDWNSFDATHVIAAGTYIFAAGIVVALMNAARRHAALLEREVEQRQRLESELRQSEERFRRIYESAAVGIVQLDRTGRFLHANKRFCEFVGYRLEELHKLSVFDLVFAGDRDEDERLFARMVAGDLPVLHREKRYVRKDGGIAWGSLTATFIRDQNGVPQSSISVVEEVTARVEAEAALHRAQQQLAAHAEELECRVEQRTAALRTSLHDMESFCYTIAHDLRAPLRAMVGFTTALVEDYSSHLEDDGKIYCTRIADAATRMDAMIAGLLEYGRLSHIAPRIERLNLAHEVEQVLQDSSDQVAQYNAEVAVEELASSVCGNSVLLRQVVRNLLTNALKFVADGTVPRVRIFSQRQNEHVRLVIEDNGIGIDPIHQSRIFDPFQRLHASDGYPGTGIGLSIAQKAVRRMGGHIGVDSTVGKGSCFWIQLPAHDHCPCEKRRCAELAI